MPLAKNTETFIIESKRIFGNRYLYHKSTYIRNHLKLIVTCRQHGDFFIRPYNHTSGRHGCAKCSAIKGGRSSRKFTQKNRPDLSNIKTPPNTRAVPTTKGGIAIVDEEDFDLVSKYSWGLYNGYARTDQFSMHRLILDFWDLSLDIDHANGNKLDNRRSNLRICTRAQNNVNKSGRKNTSSQFKGVTKRRNGTSWSAQITFSRKIIHIGTFDNEKDAALAYDKKAIEIYGEFAYLNFNQGIKPLQSTKE